MAILALAGRLRFRRPASFLFHCPALLESDRRVALCPKHRDQRAARARFIRPRVFLRRRARRAKKSLALASRLLQPLRLQRLRQDEIDPFRPRQARFSGFLRRFWIDQGAKHEVGAKESGPLARQGQKTRGKSAAAAARRARLNARAYNAKKLKCGLRRAACECSLKKAEPASARKPQGTCSQIQSALPLPKNPRFRRETTRKRRPKRKNPLPRRRGFLPTKGATEKVRCARSLARIASSRACFSALEAWLRFGLFPSIPGERRRAWDRSTSHCSSSGPKTSRHRACRSFFAPRREPRGPRRCCPGGSRLFGRRQPPSPRPDDSAKSLA